MDNNAKCCAAPRPQLRESAGALSDMLDRANDIAEAIEDKLYGLTQSESCDKACPPNTVQNGIDRSGNAIAKLVTRLDSINSRL
jgi:hypothetical protein